MNPLRTVAIKNWLTTNSHLDLSARYHEGMEVQVNVLPGTPDQRINKEFKGRSFSRWFDGVQEWGPIRIPRNANTTPEYSDVPLSWSFEDHLEAIGMTGWNWRDRTSSYVGFDFDSISNHSKGLNSAELNEILEAVKELKYVTVRYSTSGSGYHLEVNLPNVQTANHTEHAALARAILGKMCADTGFDFNAKIDACGAILWCWHRKMVGTNGLKLIKQGEILYDYPKNWDEHLEVIKGKRVKIKPGFIETEDNEDLFDKLMSEKSHTPLEPTHKKLFEYLDEVGAMWEWKNDHHLLICHTFDLKSIHTRYHMRGIFDTVSEGKEHGVDHNCFGYPIRGGAWSIRRYTQGVSEAPCWAQDRSGWTQCYFNIEPDLPSASLSLGGIEDTSRGFVFKEALVAIEVGNSLGANIVLPNHALARSATLREHRDGRLIVEVSKDENDRTEDFATWLPSKNKKFWSKIFNVQARRPIEPEIESHDDLMRHLITEGDTEAGFVSRVNSSWVQEPLTNIVHVLSAYGFDPKKSQKVIGNAIKKPFILVNEPFKPEYLGDRKWNRHAAQLKYQPRKDKEVLLYPTWKSILSHCGEGIDDLIREDKWCLDNGVKTGGDYLKIWVSSVFQKPELPLPYLFFYGPENSGKSMFHEALSLLLIRGLKRADQALINPQGFNSELDGAVICVVQETDLRQNKMAINRMKDWVNGREILIHPKSKTPYQQRNHTHWIQTSNDIAACPIPSGDTRITMVYVKQPENIVPKELMISRLEKEALDFVTELMSMDLPESNDRLGLKVLHSAAKLEMGKDARGEVQSYIEDSTFYEPGYAISIANLYDNFLLRTMSDKITKKVFIRDLMALNKYPKGRARAELTEVIGGKSGDWFIGNISFEEKKEKKRPLVLQGEYLEWV